MTMKADLWAYFCRSCRPTCKLQKTYTLTMWTHHLLSGIISRLDHFAYLNIETIWLSPIFRSPMADFGYDISNHTDIDPIFGTLSDMDELISELHRRGKIRVADILVYMYIHVYYTYPTEHQTSCSDSIE